MKNGQTSSKRGSKTASDSALNSAKRRSSARRPLTPQAEDRLSQMPKACRNTYRKAMAGESFAACIKAQCQECVGYEDMANGIRNCTAPACPLYAKRPYQTGRQQLVEED